MPRRKPSLRVGLPVLAIGIAMISVSYFGVQPLQNGRPPLCFPEIMSFPGIIRDSRAGGILCNLVGRWRDDCWLSNPRRPPRVPYGSTANSPARFGSRGREHTLDGKGASARGQASKIRRDYEPCLVRVPALVLGGLETQKH